MSLMLTAAHVATLTAPDFVKFAHSCIDELCPAQQVNRDFMIDVILNRCRFHRDHFDVQNRVYDWLSERC